MAARRDLALLALGAAWGAMTLPALAGEWRVVPSVAINETVTDNVGLTEHRRESDAITDVSPGIAISGHGNRLELDLDYRLHGLYYAKDSSRNNLQNSLNARGTLEALENWFFIDAGAAITRQNLSAFNGSTYSSVDINDSGNTAETRTYRISPHFTGMLGGSTEYLLRYDFGNLRSDEGSARNERTTRLVGRLTGRAEGARFGWSVDANRQKNDFGQGRDTKADLLRGTLTYHIDPRLGLSLIAGRESNDYASRDMRSHTIQGAGFEWTPTERTLLSVFAEDRFFGNGGKVSFTHRTAGTAWKYARTRDAHTAADQSSGAVGTYFGLLDSMFSSAIPDPAARAAYVNAMLAANGISPNATLQGGFLTTGVTLREHQELSLALVGARNTVTFAATRSETEDISSRTGSGWFLGTDFSSFDAIRQTGANINWSHRLSGLSTLTGSVSRLKSKGKGSGDSQTDETMYTVNFLTRLGPKTNAGVGLRRVEVNGTVSGHTENAVTGTFSYQF
jgi:uncharacterized protein (PEP-CTERM system associated)